PAAVPRDPPDTRVTWPSGSPPPSTGCGAASTCRGERGESTSPAPTRGWSPAMTGDALRSYDELIAELRRLGLERRTGTIFIATADNESGQIGMRDGLIVHARFRRKTGLEAAYLLRKIGKARFSFTKDFVETTDPSLSAGAGVAAFTGGERPGGRPPRAPAGPKAASRADHATV